MMHKRRINVGHICCGIGGGAAGFNNGAARVGNLEAEFVCLGGIDVDPACCEDFARLTGVPATRLDLMSAGQYLAFHGHAPPAGWREAGVDDMRAAFRHEHPHILFMSMPCKGFSGLLSESLSRSAKYQALNGLTLRGLWLALEAYADDPVELILFENVPRIATRGRWLVDQILALLAAYGYAAAESKHDCGELGGLAQHRERFLLVARHKAKVPAFLYEPPRRPLRGVGEVLGRLPLPGLTGADGVPLGGPMHRVPRLQWKTWVRLAFVEAGSDWRSLNKLNVRDGVLADYGIAPEAGWYNGAFGVCDWHEPSGVISGNTNRPSCGTFSVADPRIDGHAKSVQLGVREWQQPAGVVTGKMFVGGGPHAVADPRIHGRTPFNHIYRIVKWDRPALAVSSAIEMCVADPRVEHRRNGTLGVNEWNGPSGATCGESLPPNGVFAVADPRWRDGAREGGMVTGDHSPLTIHHSLPSPTDNLVCLIRALDGTWHRPFTTLECAALQSLFDPEDAFDLSGTSDSGKRERIGNAVPRDAAAAIAGVMGTVLLLVWSGQTAMLSSTPAWVRPLAVALAVKPAEVAP